MPVRLSFAKLVAATAMVSLFNCIGCQDSSTFPVKGRLLIGGKPAGGANVVFHAIDRRIISRPVAMTESDGSFRLMTHSVDDGAPAGDYIVTIFWRDDSMQVDDCAGTDLIKHDRLHGVYFVKTRSTLRATVRREPTEITIEANEPTDVPVDKRPLRHSVPVFPAMIPDE